MDMTTFGIIGSGNIGTAVSTALTRAGHRVVIGNSRGPESLADLVAQLGENATAATAVEAAAAGEVVLVAVPFGKEDALPVAELAGKIVLDADNYYFERDGHHAALDAGESTVGGELQARLPQSKVARAFNHIGAAQIVSDGTPAGTPGRRALATSSDDPEAAAFVLALYDELGFDGVDASPLSESWRFERDRPAYVVAQTAAELEANLARAPRTI
jgi:8-hydroxy-5-deazaflavin:NADPH oxidoreductase